MRITAQLIDAAADDHIWAERYDRDLDDIFALQDEISQAIVKSLKLKLLPEEKQAIARRGASSAEAYDLYLMARQHFHMGNFSPHQLDGIVRLCAKAVEIDPGYARAWALMAHAQSALRLRFGRRDVDGSPAAERALALDPDLPETHAAMASCLRAQGRDAEAAEALATALRLDPDSFEANNAAGDLCFKDGRLAEAIAYYEKAAALMETEVGCAVMLVTCHTALGDMDGARRAARMGLDRAEAILAHDRSNGMAMGYGIAALATLGEADRCRDWIRRAVLIDPDNLLLRYNSACALCTLRDLDGAVDLLGPYFGQATRFDIDWAKADPDMDAVRDDPRFRALVAEAEARLAS